MSSPRHLWSDDWQLESAAAAEELARRRAQAEPPAPPEPEPEPAPSPRRTRARRPRRRLSMPSWRPRWRTVRLGALVALVALVCAGAAFGVSALVAGSGSKPTAAPVARVWLGMGVSGLPVGGVLVTSVVPKGPAYHAGLRRGDVITEVGEQQVQSADDVESAIAPLQPGARVKIEFDQGPGTYITYATLQKRPHDSP